MKVISQNNLNDLKTAGMKTLFPGKMKITIGTASCGLASGAGEILNYILAHWKEDFIVASTGCIGFCEAEPIISLQPADEPWTFYGFMNPDMTGVLIERVLKQLGSPEWALFKIRHEILTDIPEPAWMLKVPTVEEHPFFRYQMKIVLRNCGIIDPESLEEYVARGGYYTLFNVLNKMASLNVIDAVKKSGLRGRGGGGFPTGLKWELTQKQVSDEKFVICNADEGDPGAYMDRSVLEGDPHSVIEGMAIGAYAMGAAQGIIYVRDEYPLAVKRLEKALTQARDNGILGGGIFGTDFNFDITLARGAGAFVCGEETSLISSVEGKTGEPRQRPPYPAEKGLWGRPTNINNVETWANIPVIMARGADWFSSIGTKGSRGTKVFSLVGKIRNTGLIEVPMGISLKEIVYEIGGGVLGNRIFKAVQTGGPSGGCIPEELLDLPVDFDELTKAGSIMGSGGMIIADDKTCMVDLARYFLEFLKEESCGKCTPCREGMAQMLAILNRFTTGDAYEEELDLLEKIAVTVKKFSLCGLGQTAPNPVLSTIRYYRDEYMEHILHKKCPAMVCTKLIFTSCKFDCPVDTDIPEFIALMTHEKYDDALRVIRRTNPFGITCGYVCHHPCEERCRAGDIGDPISIKALKRYLGDSRIQMGWKPDAPKGTTKELTGKRYDVAIIGAGPAGLAAAFDLTLKGFRVKVFDDFIRPGGLLTSTIPGFRINESILETEISEILNSGVDVENGVRVGRDFSFNELLKMGFRAVLIATGTEESVKLGIRDEDKAGVIDSMTFLKEVKLGKSPELGRVVVVVGGGNAAIDTARTAWRLGVERVILVYRRTRLEMPAMSSEIQQGIDEGIEFRFLTNPIRIISDGFRITGIECIEMKLGELDKSGRRKPVAIPGSEFIIEADALLPAIGQIAELSFLKGVPGIEITKGNTIMVDKETLTTGTKGIFAAGDVEMGPSTIADAISQGKKAALHIAQYLEGKPLKPLYKPVSPCTFIEPLCLTDREIEEVVAAKRFKMACVPVGKRQGSFEIVDLGLEQEAARKEAMRCLRCDIAYWEGIQKGF